MNLKVALFLSLLALLVILVAMPAGTFPVLPPYAHT